MNNFEREICKLGAKSACEWFGVTDEDFIAETDRVLRERYPEEFKTDKPATPIGGEKEAIKDDIAIINTFICGDDSIVLQRAWLRLLAQLIESSAHTVQGEVLDVILLTEAWLRDKKNINNVSSDLLRRWLKIYGEATPIGGEKEAEKKCECGNVGKNLVGWNHYLCEQCYIDYQKWLKEKESKRSFNKE